MDTEKNKYLYGYDSQEKSYEVDNYPWGFKLKTKIRYWIETKENYGQRLCSQTQNPKTLKWCSPKYSTYSRIAILFLDEKNHVRHETINFYNNKEKIECFLVQHKEHLTDYQKEALKQIIATDTIMSKVKIEIVPVGEGNRESFIDHQKNAMKNINKAIALEKRKITI